MVVIGLLFASFAGCASAPKQSGFLDGYYKDLGPGPKGGVDERWLRPGVNFAKYNKLMIDSVIFYYAPDSEDKGIDGEKMKELTDAFNTEHRQCVEGEASHRCGAGTRRGKAQRRTHGSEEE